VIRVVCQEAQLNCVLRLYEWGHAQELVKQGKAHGMFVIGWNAARAKFLRRSLPIIETEYGFFVRADDPLTYREIADMRDYTIGVFGPSNTSRTLRQIENTLRAQDMRIHIKETRDDKPLFQELAEGSGVRAVFSNKDVGNAILNGLGVTNVKYAGQYKVLLYYVGFSQKLVPATTVEKFDAAFRKLRRAGVVQEIYANSGLVGTFGQEEAAPKQPAAAAQPPAPEAKAPEPRYTVRTLAGDEVVVDKTTCLMWQRHGSETQINWAAAQEYITALNSQKFATHADWRLPKTREVRSLLQQEIQKQNRLYIDPVFDAMQQTFWSDNETPNPESAERQFIDVYEGSLAPGNQLDTSFVRAVRGTWCQERS
jgi:polar amino acid transport system substrate-binding protein